MTAKFSIQVGTAFYLIVSLALTVAGCKRHELSPAPQSLSNSTPNLERSPVPDACELILVPPAGDGRLDKEIKRLQEQVRENRNPLQSLERLGWMYVAKARESFDPGYYKLAEQCALCLDSRQPQSPESLLLRGHVFQNLHRFKEAEPLARELVKRRGLSFDYGLLGDLLMEQGKLDEAAQFYQKMVDQRPDLESYARISHLRWLKGDLLGATEVMKLATSAASPKAPEAAAWVNTRFGLLRLQAGNPADAEQACDIALDYQPDYAPALLLRGRLLVSLGKIDQAITSLRKAARLNPLPDYLWTLSEALRAAGRVGEACEAEAQLEKDGAANDPRTFALYLSTRGKSLSTALALAKEELNTRDDVFTHDALGWALYANSRTQDALQEMKMALSEGTKDGRLFFHAAVIDCKAGDKKQAEQSLMRAASMASLLLPTERQQLLNAAQEFGRPELIADPLFSGPGSAGVSPAVKILLKQQLAGETPSLPGANQTLFTSGTQQPGRK